MTLPRPTRKLRGAHNKRGVKMTIQLHVDAATADELKTILCSLTGAVDITTMSNGDILHYLRGRFVQEGKVVKVMDVIPPDETDPDDPEEMPPQTETTAEIIPMASRRAA
jgi:hypothetical protein